MRSKFIRALGILTGISAVLAAGGLIYEAARIYRAGLSSGAQMYTYETIGLAFEEIAPVLWAFIGLSLTMLLLRAFVSFRPAARISPDTAFDFLRLRVDADASPAIKRELRLQRHVSSSGAAVMLLCAAVIVYGVFSGSRFTTTDLEAEMGRFLPLLIIPTLAALAAAYICFTVYVLSRKRCVTAMKALPKHQVAVPETHKTALICARVALLALAAAFTALGIMNGGLHDVLVKAINICTECIGLG